MRRLRELSKRIICSILRLLTQVGNSVSCLFNRMTSSTFSVVITFFYFLCFHMQKHLILHTPAISL